MNYNLDEQYNCVVITLKGNVMGGPDGSKLLDTARPTWLLISARSSS